MDICERLAKLADDINGLSLQDVLLRDVKGALQSAKYEIEYLRKLAGVVTEGPVARDIMKEIRNAASV